MRFFTVARDKTYSVLLLISRLYIFDNIPSFWFKKPNFLPPNPASGCWALFNASVNSSYLKCLSFFIQLLLSFLFLPRSLAATTRRTQLLAALLICSRNHPLLLNASLSYHAIHTGYSTSPPLLFFLVGYPSCPSAQSLFLCLTAFCINDHTGFCVVTIHASGIVKFTSTSAHLTTLRRLRFYL